MDLSINHYNYYYYYDYHSHYHYHYHYYYYIIIKYQLRKYFKENELLTSGQIAVQCREAIGRAIRGHRTVNCFISIIGMYVSLFYFAL